MLDSLFRKLPPFKGKNRAARLLLNNEIRSLTDVLIEGKFNCKYLLPNLQENVGFDIFVNGVYEESTIRFLQRIIPQNGRLLDIGANIGAISVPLCKLRTDIQLLAVEAAPWIFEYLTKNIGLNNLDNITLCNYALFDKDNVEVDFFTPRGKFGKGSLSPIFSQDAVRVATRRVDTLLQECHFQNPATLKVDVEGFEYFVFKGAEQLLRSASPPDIVFEFVDWAEKAAMDSVGNAQVFLTELGYKLYILQGEKPERIYQTIQSGSMNLFASFSE